MNNSTVWSPPTTMQRRSGPRRARSDREPRVECATWKSLKTIGKRCVSSVHHRCTGAVTILCCAPVITWGAPEMHKILWIMQWKTDQKARDMGPSRTSEWDMGVYIGTYQWMHGIFVLLWAYSFVGLL